MRTASNRGVRRGSPYGKLDVMEKQAPEKRIVGALVCLECRTEAGPARGWRAYVDTDECLLVYCPRCAAREFDN
jgi:ribosomal protein L44E